VRVAGRRRTAWLTGVATVAAVLWLTGNFGVVDFVDGFTGFVGQARNQVLDVGWGAVFGVIVPLGLLSQLRRPERRIAGIQQTGIVAAALAWAAVTLGLGLQPRAREDPLTAGAPAPGG
jgi:hypothetical protein